MRTTLTKKQAKAWHLEVIGMLLVLGFEEVHDKSTYGETVWELQTPLGAYWCYTHEEGYETGNQTVALNGRFAHVGLEDAQTYDINPHSFKMCFCEWAADRQKLLSAFRERVGRIMARVRV